MRNVLIRLLSILLTSYIAFTIIFRQYYFNITHAVDLLLIITFIVLMLVEKEERYKINSMLGAYALFIAISFASSFWGLDFYRSWYKASQLTLILINLFIMYNVVKKYDLMYTFFNGVLIGSFINYLILLNIVQVPFDIYIGMGVHLRAVGTMGNPNTLATTMLISMLVSMLYLFKEKDMNKVFYYYQFINIGLAAYVIVMTVSKKGILLGSSFLLIYLLLSLGSKRGINQIIILSILSSIVLTYFIDWEAFSILLDYVGQRFDVFANDISHTNTAVNTSTEIRKKLVEIGWNAFQERPMLGYGLDNFRLISRAEYSHNTFIELLVGVGLIGALAFYSIHIILLKKIYMMRKSELKLFLYFFLCCTLLMDLTTVSYGAKLMLYALLYMTILAESEREKGK